MRFLSNFLVSMCFCGFIFGWVYAWMGTGDATIAAGAVAMVCGALSANDLERRGR